MQFRISVLHLELSGRVGQFPGQLRWPFRTPDGEDICEIWGVTGEGGRELSWLTLFLLFGAFNKSQNTRHVCCFLRFNWANFKRRLVTRLLPETENAPSDILRRAPIYRRQIELSRLKKIKLALHTMQSAAGQWSSNCEKFVNHGREQFTNHNVSVSKTGQHLMRRSRSKEKQAFAGTRK